MPEPMETVDLKGVECFDVGTWNRQEYEDRDLDGMVSTFYELRGVVDPPAKIGHDPDQSILRRSGFPAAGWVSRLYRDGSKLVADVSRVPKTIADLIEKGAYRKVSSEVLINATFNGKTYPYVFSGLAFLGEELPAVTSIGDIRDLYAAHFARGGRAAEITREHTSAPLAQREGQMPNKDEEAALVGTLERLKKSAGFATFARETLSRLRKWTTRTHADASLENKLSALQEAVNNRFGGLDGYVWICATYDDRVIVQKGEDYYAIPYQMAEDGTVTFDEAYEVEQTWTATVTQTGTNGDLPADAPPTPETSGDTATAQAALARKEPDDMKSIAHALGLPDTATETEIVAAIAARPTPEAFKALETKVTTLETHNVTEAATSKVDAAIRAKKIAPSSKDGMVAFALANPTAFDAMIEKAPALFTTSGSEADAPLSRSAADDINAKVVETMKADSSGKLTFAAALDQVSRAHPDLARKYVDEQRGTARLS